MGPSKRELKTCFTHQVNNKLLLFPRTLLRNVPSRTYLKILSFFRHLSKSFVSIHVYMLRESWWSSQWRYCLLNSDNLRENKMKIKIDIITSLSDHYRHCRPIIIFARNIYPDILHICLLLTTSHVKCDVFMHFQHSTFKYFRTNIILSS